MTLPLESRTSTFGTQFQRQFIKIPTTIRQTANKQHHRKLVVRHSDGAQDCQNSDDIEDSSNDDHDYA